MDGWMDGGWLVDSFLAFRLVDGQTGWLAKFPGNCLLGSLIADWLGG
jgi:hypothetical protein